MKFQPTFLQARGYGRPYLLGFRLRPAMHDGIIDIPLEPLRLTRLAEVLDQVHTCIYEAEFKND